MNNVKFSTRKVNLDDKNYSCVILTFFYKVTLTRIKATELLLSLANFAVEEVAQP